MTVRVLVEFNAQVLVDKLVQVGVVKDVEVVVSLVVKVVANSCAKMIALWVVRDNVPMDVPVVARVDVLVHAVATVATDAAAVAMAQLVYSNGRY